MFGGLEEKCEQALAALGQICERDFSKIVVERRTDEFCHSIGVDFSDGISDAEMQNSLSSLVANIASLKDHLKNWCKQNSSNFDAESVLNSSHEAAIVHDLWNSDKHGGLDRKPRSGVTPRIVNLGKYLVTSVSGPDAAAFFSMDIQTGKIEHGATGGGSIAHKIVAQIEDENGNHLGDCEDVCRAALDAWLNAMRAAGVSLESR